MVQHGVSELTQERILLGPGAVYIGDPAAYGELLGATKGGNVFEINRTLRDIRPDGAKGKVKGFRMLESCEAILTVKLLEITEDAVNKAIAGSALANHIITGGEVADGTYLDVVTIVAQLTGTIQSTESNSVICRLMNCLVEGPVTLTLPDKGEAAIELKFHAHFDPADMDTEPWEIEFVPVP